MIARYDNLEDALNFRHNHATVPCRVIQGLTGVYWVVKPGAAKLLIEIGFVDMEGNNA